MKYARFLSSVPKVLVIIFLVFMFSSTLQAANPKGVFIYRDSPGSSDEFARVVEFDTIQIFSQVVNFTHHEGGKGNASTLRPNLVEIIRYPDTDSGTIATAKEIANLNSVITQLKAALKRFRGANGVINDDIKRLSAAQQMLSQGILLVNGQWKKPGSDPQMPAKTGKNALDPDRIAKLKVMKEGIEITYENVKIIAAEDGQLRIYHSSGAATIPFENLPPDLQKRYKFHPEKTPQVSSDQSLIPYRILNRNELGAVKVSFDILVGFQKNGDRLRKPTEGEIAMLSRHLISKEKKHERSFVLLYLPGMELDAGAWATAHHNPQLKVQIIGLQASRVREEILKDDLATAPAKEPVPSVAPQDSTKHSEKEPFYEGGNLQKSTVVEWRKATPRNKLATASDWLSSKWKGDLNSRSDFDRFKIKSRMLVFGIDAGVSSEEVDSMKVLEIADALITLLGDSFGP